MKDFTDSLIVKSETIIEFLKWAETQPRTIGQFHLTIEDVPEPRNG